MRSRHISQVIHREPAVVYAFASDPDNLPRWAGGLAQGEVRREGEALVVDSPMGRVSVRFVETNPYGVLDHDVTLPTGEVVHNPLRVLAHPEGSEVVFTLRQREMTNEEFDADTASITDDLHALKELLESS